MDKVKCFKNLCNRISSLYEAKNKDYGDSFGKSFAEFGPIAGVVRLGDKYNRIKNLVMSMDNPAVKTESVVDTLLDNAAYSIMLAMEIIKGNNEEPTD